MLLAYLRVSTVEQAESQAGLQAQLDAITKTIGAPDKVFTDAGVSGGAPMDKRPALLDVLDAAGNGDVIAVAKRDRLARDMVVAAMVEREASRRGASIVSAAGEGSNSEGPEGFLVRRMMDLLAEYERMLIASRTRAALKAKSQRGQRVGRIPFGFTVEDDGVTLVECDMEQAVLNRIREEREAGTPWRTIAGMLGPHPRTGKSWAHTQLMRLTRLH